MRSMAYAMVIALLGLCSVAYGRVPPNNPYPSMAPVSQYLMPREAEIEMARSAGPASISAHAEVLVLTRSGYIVAAKGSNGWTCLVGRMWVAGFDDPEFWNPKGRGAACLNPQAVKSVLPQYLARTKWALAGDSREQIAKKCKAAYADHKFTDPAPESFAFMLSKESYLNDTVKGPWRPHVMPFVAYSHIPRWAAGFEGSPILSPATATFRRYEPVTIVIPVDYWSDGSLAPK